MERPLIRMSEEEMQEVEKFNYLEVMISMDGGVGRKWLVGCLREERYWERWENCGKRT